MNGNGQKSNEATLPRLETEPVFTMLASCNGGRLAGIPLVIIPQ